MNATDSSIHGWFLGPVPIVLGVWGFIELARILFKRKKVTRSSIPSIYGLSPGIVTLACFAMGVAARDDLTVRILAIGSVLSGVLSVALHGLIWWSASAPGLNDWFADGKELRTHLLVKRLLISLFVLFCVFVTFSIFGLGSAECTTSRCRSGVILFGSNLGAGVMWLIFAACGFFVSMFLASVHDLARRAAVRDE